MTVHLLTGDDESILRAAVSELVHELVGDGDRSLMVDEFDGDDVEVRSVVDAAQTPPFLTDRRVVVVRDIGGFTTEELAPLVGYLADPLPTTELVMVGGGGRLAKALTDAAKAAGAVVRNTTPPSRRRIARPGSPPRPRPVGVKLAPAAASAIADRLGEEVGRLDGILQTLAATYGGGARQLGPDEVEPFLGEGGGVPPWELTDAIDAGSTATALALLGQDVRSRRSPSVAADGDPARPLRAIGPPRRRRRDLGGAGGQALGIKPGFPAKKALTQYRRLGGGGVQRAIDLLAAADLDLRGARDLPDDVIMDVLVARLSRLRR